LSKIFFEKNILQDKSIYVEGSIHL
jgi:hypothetical protein